MHKMTRHLSAKYAFAKTRQAQAHLVEILGLHPLAEERLEHDRIYYTREGKIKLRENDASSLQPGIRTIITESTQTCDDGLRNHAVTVLSPVPRDYYEQALKNHGEPHYKVIKGRTVYLQQDNPQLRVYIDSHVQITACNMREIIPDQAFLEIQASYHDEETMRRQQEFMQNMLAQLRNQREIAPSPSYGVFINM